MPLLKPGQTISLQETMTIRPETAPGQYKLQACADSTKTAPEEDEQNNCLTSSGNIQVTPQPNLVVTSVVAGLPNHEQHGDRHDQLTPPRTTHRPPGDDLIARRSGVQAVPWNRGAISAGRAPRAAA